MDPGDDFEFEAWHVDPGGQVLGQVEHRVLAMDAEVLNSTRIAPLGWEDEVCGRNIAALVLESTEERHTLDMLARLISGVVGHIEELLIDRLWPEDLGALDGKVAGTWRRLVVAIVGEVYLPRRLVRHLREFIIRLKMKGCQISLGAGRELKTLANHL